ncbi:sulfate transporter family-domain-containing protein [Pelagophyceae sp. CCMP2097]|nr:sulfate transporter family-domain-containing protein [Pelagophyceae sp. CCMP2097]
MSPPTCCTSRGMRSPLLTEEALGDEPRGEEAEAPDDDDDEYGAGEGARAAGAAGAAARPGWRGVRCDGDVVDGLKKDAVAGLTVGIVLIPQGMAYGLLAGLSPVYGLYCGVVPNLVYGCVGTSLHLNIGPFALVSLLSFTAAQDVCKLTNCAVSPESPCFVGVTLTLALLTGLLQLAFAASGLGEVVESVLADSVMNGFTSAAAVLISTSQASHLVGFDAATKERAVRRALRLAPRVSAASDFLKQWLAILCTAGAWNAQAVSVGVGSTAMLLALRHLKKAQHLPRLPEQLIVLAVVTALSAALGSHLEVPKVGALPSGFMPVGAPWAAAGLARDASVAVWAALLKGAATLAAVAFVLSLAVAKSLQQTFAPRAAPLSASRELAALGAANVLGSFFGSYPAAGSLSRSAVAAEAGAVSARFNVVAALVVLVTLVALTPLFAAVPMAVLSAVVLVSVASLFDVGEPRRLWRRGHKGDAATWAVAFTATLLLGVQSGLVCGVAGSLVRVIRAAARPHVAALGRIEGYPDVYRDLRRRRNAATNAARPVPGVAIVRFGGGLHFASRGHFAAAVHEARAGRKAPPRCRGPARLARAVSTRFSKADATVRRRPPRENAATAVHAIVLDCSGMDGVDSSGEKALREAVVSLEAGGVTLILACARGALRDQLFRGGVFRRSHVFPALHDGVVFAVRGAPLYAPGAPCAWSDS